MNTQIRICFLLLALVCSSFVPLGGRYPVYAKQGMVVSSSMPASEIGRDVLMAGGNAIDAAVATAFALAVTYPGAGNIGGGGFMVYVPKSGEATTIDFREKAPLAATEKMFMDQSGKLIPQSNLEGILAPGTPGTVAGLFLAHQKYGRLPWRLLLDPAVKLATNGIIITHALQEDGKNFQYLWRKYPSTAKVLLKNGRPYMQGESWKQHDLARTLKRISEKGRDGFYSGETAAQFAQFMKRNGGLITEKDLAQYQAIERKPIHGTYRGYELYSMAPPSSGGVALIEMLNILEGYDLTEVGYASADYYTLLSEVMRRAFADRAQFLGDPDFIKDIPLTRLTSKAYAATQRAGIQFYKSSPSDSTRFGQIYEGSNHTTHFSVVDKEGNAVAVTYTIENWFGSQLVVDGLGFLLNNEMGDFNPVPGVTTSNGQIGTSPNLIAPGKRMLSSMTPTILTKDGKPFLVIGAPGGRTIINTVLQVILNVVDHHMPISRAIEEPRIHHQWLPDVLLSERLEINKDTRAILSSRGFRLGDLEWTGDAMGILIDPKTHQLLGASDSRGEDAGAAGY
ncbi:MAG: gamma-glutamyltransferase [Bacteroidetes bacterium]|nr:gamma-glutamyltransferase [Bacteroidota bacterium]